MEWEKKHLKMLSAADTFMVSCSDFHAKNEIASL